MHPEPHLIQAHQAAQLACAEFKALNQHYMQAEGMDDMGDYLDRLDGEQIKQRLAAGRLQARVGGRHG